MASGDSPGARNASAHAALVRVLAEVIEPDEARHFAGNCAQTLVLLRELGDRVPTETLLREALRARRAGWPGSVWARLDDAHLDTLAARCAFAWDAAWG